LTLAEVRDVALIVGIVVFVIESLLLGALFALVALRMLAFIDLAQARLDDMAETAGSVLESAREAATAANEAAVQVRGSTSFLSDRLVYPAIRVAGAFSGVARFARAVVSPSSSRKGVNRGEGQ
jgi:hypothetical protein